MHKVDNIAIFVLLLMEINWIHQITELISMQIGRCFEFIYLLKWLIFYVTYFQK